jgi:hypothetical protein
MDNDYWGYVHPDVRDICFPISSDLNVVYLATDGGIERNLEDNKYTWDVLNGDLVLAECYSVAISEQDPEYFLTGAQDNGVYQRIGTSWTNWTTWVGDGSEGCVVSWENDFNNVLNGSGGRNKSVDRGVTWSSFGPSGSGLLQHPVNADTYFAADYIISRTDDFGNSWDNWFYAGGRVTAMAISKSDPNYFYCSTRDFDFSIPGWPATLHLWKSIDDGSNWTELTSNIEAVDPEIISTRLSEIEIHPTDENIVWVTFGNFSENNKVLQTTNGGESWQNISYNLANIPTNSIKYDAYTDMLLLATDVGVYYLIDVLSTGTDQTWERYGDIPLTIASDIKINNNTKDLIVATYGRGIWRTNLSCIKTEGLTQISGTEVWEGAKSIIKDVELLQGSHLNIKGVTSIALDVRITVNRGAKLVIDGATLTNTCGNLWHGIQVLGTPSAGQNPVDQGYVQIINEGTIENSEYGVYAFKMIKD